MIRSKFAISMHILSLLGKHKGEWLSSGKIADSLNMNSALVRRELSNLCTYDLIVCKEGKGGGSKLAKPADNIEISDVMNAVKSVHILGFAKNIPNPQCPIGRDINYVLHGLYMEIDEHVDNMLSKISLQDFLERFY